MDNTKHLEKLLKVFNADNIITPEEIDQVLAGITAVLSTFKGETEKLNSDTQKKLEKLLVEVEKKHEKVLKTVDKTVSLDNKKLSSSFASSMEEIKLLIQEVKNAKPKDGKDGKDVDPADVVPLVLEQIKLPEHKEVVLDDATQIKEKLESLKKDDRLDISAIKGITKLQDRIVEHATTQARGLLYAGLLENTNSGGSGGGYTNLTQFVDQTAWRVFYSNGSGDVTELALGADGTFLKSNGATSAPTFATPAGSGDVTKVGTPVNNQVGVWTGDGTLEGDAALTFDTTTDVLSSGGLLLSGLTASEMVITDASKNLVSAAVATYPSLTELTYVKGVTSAIQTQINAKAPSTSPTFATSITGSYLTASEILITDASKNIVSAPVATYPSLTELTYVKGVTSAIQTQIGTKAAHATTITIAGTANQITSSAGAQDLSANRTWTLSLPADVLIPTVLTVPNTGLHLLDTNASHDLIIKPGSNITADRTLTITTGDTDMIVDFTAVTDEYVLAYDTGTNTWRGVAASGSGATTALDNLASVAINAALVLGTSDAFALGSATKQWSDLFLAEGGVINWDNGDLLLTQTGNVLDLTGGNLTIGTPTLISTAGLNIKATTGNTYHLFLEGTGGVVVPTIGFKHSSDTTGVALTGNDSGFAFSNIGEGQTLFMKPGYPDAYWKTHGSSAAKFHIQSYLDGTGYLDSIVLTSGWCAFGHTTPDRLMHGEVAGTATNTVAYVLRIGHVSSDTVTTAFGVGQEYELENASGTNKVVATQEMVYTDATNTSEDADFILKLMAAGTLAERFRITSDGAVALITGATINFASGNVVLTHSSGILTVSTGDLRVTTAGTNTASVVTVGGTQTLTGKTLTSPAITTATLSGTQLLAEGGSIGLDPSASADGAYSGITITATSGYAQAFGDLVYLDPTDSRWEAVDANAASGADGDARGILGMVVVAGTDGNACTILLQGVIRADANFPALTVNAPVYASETAGDIVVTQPTTADVVIRVVGFALTADSIYFNPSPNFITHT